MVDGNDMLAVYDAAKRAVETARGGGGPMLLGVDTMRMKGHAAHDDMRYVPPDMVEAWTKRDPIALYRARLARDARRDDSRARRDRRDDEGLRRIRIAAGGRSAGSGSGDRRARVCSAPIRSCIPSVEIVRSPFAEPQAAR